MGLASLNTAHVANTGAPMIVLHFSDRTPLIGDDGHPVSITLLGKDSDIFIASEREAQNANVDNMAKGAKWSAAERAHRFAVTLAKCTVGWHNVPQGWIDGTEDEAPAVCNYDNALKLYTNPGYAWVREQADAFVGDRGNFLKA